MSQSTEPRKSYVTDLTDQQWAIIEPLLPVPKNQYGGRPRRVSLREVINAVLYLNRAGCQWDLLPHDFPPKSTVYDDCAHGGTTDDGNAPAHARCVAVITGKVRRSKIKVTKTGQEGGDPKGFPPHT